MSQQSENDLLYYRKGTTYTQAEVNAIVSLTASGDLGPATTATNPGAVVAGRSYTFSVAGTYTYFLDNTAAPIVIPTPAAGYAIVNGRFYYNGSYWASSYNLITIPAATNKIATWAAASFATGDQVNYNGVDYFANAATISTDVPGVSTKWSVRVDAVKASTVGYIRTGDNLFNKTTFRQDISILSTGATSANVGAKSTIDIPIDPTNTQLTVSGMNAGFTHKPAFLDASLTVITPTPSSIAAGGTITIPSNAAYFRINFRVSTEVDDNGLNNMMINYGAIALAYQAYTASVLTLGANKVVSQWVIINGKLTTSDNLQVKKGDLRVYISTTANQWYVRIPFNAAYDLVHIWQLDPLNLIPEFTTVLKVPIALADGESYFGSLPTGVGNIHSPNDDISPVRMDNGADIGGGHGVDTKTVTLTAHGKTTADCPSEWSDGTFHWYLIDVPDANTLKFIAQKATNSNGDYMPSGFNTTTLTHVTGATNTGSINAATNTAVQMGPVTKNTSYKLVLDGVLLSAVSGVYYGNVFKVVDNHRIVDPRAATIQYPFLPNVGTDLVENNICYTYDKTNTCIVDHTTNFLATFYIPYYSFVQGLRFITSFESAGVTMLYIPNTGSISNGTTTYNLATTPANIFNPLGGTSLIFGSANIPDNTRAVNRVIEVQQTSGGVRKNGYAFGFSPVLGVTSDTNRKTFSEQMEVRGNSAKLYPRGIFNYSANGQVLQARLYRSYWDSTVNPNATAVYCYKENADYWLFVDYHQTVSKERIFIPDYLKGKTITVVQTGGTFTLHTAGYVPEAATLLVSVTTFGFIVLKLS